VALVMNAPPAPPAAKKPRVHADPGEKADWTVCRVLRVSLSLTPSLQAAALSTLGASGSGFRLLDGSFDWGSPAEERVASAANLAADAEAERAMQEGMVREHAAQEQAMPWMRAPCVQSTPGARGFMGGSGGRFAFITSPPAVTPLRAAPRGAPTPSSAAAMEDRGQAVCARR